MTSEEYIKHYVSGQGGFESVSVDVALQAVKHAKLEAVEQMIKDAVEVKVEFRFHRLMIDLEENRIKAFEAGDKVKLIIIKQEEE